MAYQFTPDLVTGNALIDSEHRQLIQAINDLLSACQAGRGRDALAQTTKFLYDYTSKHFADEERLQLQYHYPEYATHHQYHEAFKSSVKALSDKLNAQGPSVALVAELNTALAGWLINHIKREDVRVAAHIKASGK